MFFIYCLIVIFKYVNDELVLNCVKKKKIGYFSVVVFNNFVICILLVILMFILD